MTDNVVSFPPAEPLPELLVGPFEYYKVVVDGRAIPGLTGFKDGPDKTVLIVDGRFSVSFPNDLAQPAAWLLANALAIGQGYPSMNATSKDTPFAPQIAQLGGLPQ